MTRDAILAEIASLAGDLQREAIFRFFWAILADPEVADETISAAWQESRETAFAMLR